MATVKINIYEISNSFDGRSHSVIEFASAIFFPTKPFKKIWLDNNDDDYREGTEFIEFSPKGLLRPIASPLVDERCNVVRSFKDFIYFDVSPRLLEAILKMTLRKSDEIFHLRLDVVQKKCFSDLILLSDKIFPRWFFRIRNSFDCYRKEGEVVMRPEKTELDRIVYVMKTIVHRAFEAQMKKIYSGTKALSSSLSSLSLSSPLSSLPHEGIFQFLLKKWFFECEEIICSIRELSQTKGISKRLLKESRFLNFVLPSNDISRLPGCSTRKDERNFTEFAKHDFTNVLRSLKEKGDIWKIPQNIIEENRCALMLVSTIECLRDPSLIHLLEFGKLAFLRFFAIPGIPILIKNNRDHRGNESARKGIPPWNASVILSDKKNRYPMLSQTSLDDTFDFNYFNNYKNEEQEEVEEEEEDERGDDLDVTIKNNSCRGVVTLNDGTAFNAIVPIFSPELAVLLKPIVRTHLFASVCTYSIFKNAGDVYLHGHLAALALVCIKFLIFGERQFDYVGKKLEFICSTAALYLDHRDFVAYKKKLMKFPDLALNESENLVKPLFFIYIYRNEKPNEKKKIQLLSFLTREFINRIVYKAIQKRGYDDALLQFFFASGRKLTCNPDLEGYFIKSSQDIVKRLSSDQNVSLISLKENLKQPPIEESTSNSEKTTEFDLGNHIGLDEKLIFEQRDEDYIGDFDLRDLKLISERHFGSRGDDWEEGGKNTAVGRIFTNENIFRYVYHSFTTNSLIHTFPKNKQVQYRAHVSHKEALERTTSKIYKILKG